MALVTVETTVSNGIILQLNRAPSLYTTPPAYQSVSIASAQQGGGTQVDENFWTAWQAENAANPLLVNGQIFQP